MDSASAIGDSRVLHRVGHRHDDAPLIDIVARATRAVLRRGGAVVWIGTDTGLRWLEAGLNGLDVDVMDARLKRRILCFDAKHTLAGITADGLVDIVHFAERVGAQIDKSANRYVRVAIFCEANGTTSAFEALLKSFAQSRAVFSYRGYRTRDKELSSLTYHRVALELEHTLWSGEHAKSLMGSLSLAGNRYHYAQFAGLDSVLAFEVSASLLLEL